MKTMKKIVAVFLAIIMSSLCGCAFMSTTINSIDDIEALKGWSFQYNSGTNDYSLFFGLLNSNDEYIAADVDVDIRIINDTGEEVYSATKSVTSEDFGNYESQVAGEQYLADVRIPASDIKNGTSNNGTVYLTVYKDDTVRFDEVNCSALYCLPIADVQLTAEGIPVEINVQGYDGNTQSIIQITDVSYVYEKDFTPQLKITFSGQKTYGNSSDYDVISYKLYDSSGYLIDSGNIYLDALTAGDKFKDDSITVYDITPGENYKLLFTEYNW